MFLDVAFGTCYVLDWGSQRAVVRHMHKVLVWEIAGVGLEKAPFLYVVIACKVWLCT